MTDYGYSLLGPDWAALVPVVHGDEGAGAGIIGLVERVLEKIGGLIESGASWVLFPGIKTLAMNVHPMLVHFPIAFLTGFFLLEIIGVVLRRPNLRQAAGWMLYLGALGAVLAAAAGLVAAGNVPHGETVHEVMDWHERLMLTVAGLAVVLAVWRAAVAGQFGSRMAQALHWMLGTLMVTLLALGTDLGGLMVYRHGVGVAGLQRDAETSRHAHGAASDREPEHDPESQRAGPRVLDLR